MKLLLTDGLAVCREYMGPLLEAVKTKNREAAREWSYMDHWGQVQALAQAIHTQYPHSKSINHPSGNPCREVTEGRTFFQI
jgi:hypothetical protein